MDLHRRAITTVALVALVALASQLPASASGQVAAGRINDFQDGSTQGWLINLLGMGTPPAAAIPTNIATGGPGGTGDRFLQLRGVGGNGAGGKVMALNLTPGWTGDYLAAGITSIRMNAINLGATELFLRFLVEDPTMTSGPTNIAISADPVMLAAGSGWQTIEFPLFGASGLTAFMGNVEAVLRNTTAVRIFHGPALSEQTEPGPPPYPPEPVVGVLGIDNLTAVSAVPEPSTVVLLGTGILGLLVARHRRRRSS
jgi:hypothetical protein